MAPSPDQPYIGRAGEKLKTALNCLGIDLAGAVTADFGCNVGGFTDCMLQEGARRVYAVDTGYGALEWKLRQDERVVAMERTNAMHVELPEPMDAVAVDVGWTRQHHILPSALRVVRPEGVILSLFKPQYEAEREQVDRGQVRPEAFSDVLCTTLDRLREAGILVRRIVPLPRTRKGKNPELILEVLPGDCAPRRGGRP